MIITASDTSEVHCGFLKKPMNRCMDTSIDSSREVEVEVEGIGREGNGREGKGREGKGREGKGREGKGREGKGREGKGRQGRVHTCNS